MLKFKMLTFCLKNISTKWQKPTEFKCSEYDFLNEITAVYLDQKAKGTVTARSSTLPLC